MNNKLNIYTYKGIKNKQLKHKIYNIKAKGHEAYEYISQVKGQGQQYPHTVDLDLGPGSGLRKSLWYQPSPTTVCKHVFPNQLQNSYKKEVLV